MMSNDFDYSETHVLLLDGQRNIRTLLNGALQQIGFRNIHESTDPAAARAATSRLSLDLIILDLDTDRQTVCSLMRDLRHQVVGGNPFVVIIATTWNPDEENVRSALNAGADDIVSKPISVQILTDRVNNLVRNRKQFVATPTYLGPDRRPGGRDAMDGRMTTVAVPNSLRHKVTGDQSAAVDADSIWRANRAVSLQKLKRLAGQVDALAARLEQIAAEHQRRPVKGAKIDELSSLAFQACEVAADAEVQELSRLTISMGEVIEDISQSEIPTARQFEILRLHSQAIGVLLDGGGGGGSDLIASALNQARAVAGAAAN
ncbi:MAG: response regulator [Alphaproteobacteria bacterium]